MLPLLLTIFCSTSIALILKQNDSRKGDAITLLMGNYLVAAGISFFLILIKSDVNFSFPTLFFGMTLALLFVASFFSFAKAVGAAGTALATVSSRLSVVVPVILSILIYRETPTSLQLAGFAFTLLTIGFFYRSLRNLSRGPLRLTEYFYLMAVLIGIGINDFAMKVFKQWRPATEEPFFLLTIFGFAFLYTALYLLIRRQPIHFATFRLGAILGVPNMFSSFFLLAALAQLPGIIVYPLTNIGIILLTALGALLIWQERMNRFGQLAMISGVVAIILLGL